MADDAVQVTPGLRRARPGDAAQLHPLLDQLGYVMDIDRLAARLAWFAADASSPVWVAEYKGRVVGCIACHLTPPLHQVEPLGRITALVVDENLRGLGIGKALVNEADDFFRSQGCLAAELTSSDHRLAAHAFYEARGYRADKRRFLKSFD
ncbi:GNAT family N-acetyltransferase [Saccharospirillum salsuginis]|uniref:N-acetyltransferase domain-containing protein n=1 Tax=Saccharospirillum salsuginis TaxID=418750 RepID=A0A918KC72_9GAMM|nr:GNAT family N-acetyltransferase [Saccharospirillum salsuginis]GGX58244.1 hypothetical protein GCM10007392_27550 [Saccharospirillum salsuginis]